MSIKKNLVKNGVATGFQKMVRVLEQLLLVPFFISAWGTGYYGEWLTLTIIPSMLAFSDLGFGSAAANTFVLKYAAGERQEAANVMKSGFFIISVSILASIVIGGIALVILNYFNVFEKSLISKYDAIWAVSLLMIARILNFYQQLFEAYFRSARRASLSTNLLSAYTVINLAISVLVLINGGGIILFSLVNLVVSVVFNAFYGWRAELLLKLGKEFKGEVRKNDIKEISNKGFGYLLSPIWQSVYFQGSTFVVRLTLGPEAVAIFNTVRTVSRSANQAFTMVNNTVFPEMQFEIGAGRKAKARQLFRMATGAVSVMAILCMLLLWILGPWLYEMWTKNALHAPPAMWRIFIIGIGFNALWWTASIVFRAVNKPYSLAILGLVSSIVSVVLSYFLSLKFGLTGAAIGSLALDLIMAFYILPLSCRLLGQRLERLPRELSEDLIAVFKRRRAAEV